MMSVAVALVRRAAELEPEPGDLELGTGRCWTRWPWR
jgi:hypothetical protein